MEALRNIAIPSDYIFYILGGIMLLGIILGFFKKITVYRDFKDLGLVYLLLVIPFGIGLLTSQFGGSEKIKQAAMWAVIGLDSFILILIFIQTYKDNSNIFATVLAFYVKVFLGILFTFYLFQFIFPDRATSEQRRKSRAFSGMILLLLTPIVFGLVRNRVWDYERKINSR